MGGLGFLEEAGGGDVTNKGLKARVCHADT
jgi:hypothetical protein